MAKNTVTKTEEEIRGEINSYELLLRDTDYISHKHADGALTDEEYEAIRVQREEWRQAIRDLRELLPDEAE
ncbi:MAG: hypothetical protein K6E34_04640 [Lachnospiraceae bacterium]|nr:hypothetical protein [Lachnospiraceae bacterium]